ncbi:hypothetical protein MHK_005081, partial [Candidatus Magnetomorum sp. HK-1]
MNCNYNPIKQEILWDGNIEYSKFPLLNQSIFDKINWGEYVHCNKINYLLAESFEISSEKLLISGRIENILMALLLFLLKRTGNVTVGIISPSYYDTYTRIVKTSN